MNKPAVDPASDRQTATAWGLVSWLGKTRITLPLKGVECRFSVRGRLASVEMDQIFYQDAKDVLDVVYTFPLPAEAAIYRCELHVNERLIAAKIEDLETARKTFAEKSAAGHRAALIESVRENLFELALGNLAPGDVVAVRLAYFESLEPLEGRLTLRLPFCPGIRYTPGKPLLRANVGTGVTDDTDQVPDASRLNPPRIDALHPDAAYVCVEGVLHGCAVEVTSPSHTLVVRDAGNAAEVRLGNRGAVPDRDVVIEFEPSAGDALRTQGWCTGQNERTHALLTFQAPAVTETSGTWAQDVYFLVDRSGSMGGKKWTATAQALRAFLGHLAPQDRAWVTFFESDFQDLAEKPLSPAALLAEKAIRKLEDWAVGGGTELLPAVRHVLEKCKALSPGRNVAVVVITDGQMGNEAEIRQAFRTHPDIRVHTFGIDTCVNDAFLKGLARQQRGSCHLVTPNDDIASTIAALGARLRRPVLTDLRLTAPGWEWPAEAPADIFAGDSPTLCARGPAGATQVVVCGTLPDGSRHETSIDLVPVEDPAVSRLWSRGRIQHLLECGKSADAISLAKDANLLCEGAAFIAWDAAEKVAVRTKRSIYQPSLDPGEWEQPVKLSALPLMLKIASPMRPRPADRRYRDLGPVHGGILFSVVADAVEDKTPLVRGKGAARWRSKLKTAWKRLRKSSAESWLDWLEQWAQSEPVKQKDRERLLSQLAAEVSAALRGRTKIALIRAWITANLSAQPAFFKPISEGLDKL
ncbi:MAG: VWA domain-containing protein [Verrucomicrobiales bacterium]|nr:VWA domain-containing protein [Verrucomicrobiales bacterium]